MNSIRITSAERVYVPLTSSQNEQKEKENINQKNRESNGMN